MAALLKVHGRGWIQESYETGDPDLKARASELRRRGYRAKSFSMGSQVTQYGRVKMTMLDIRPGTSGDEYLEQVNPRRKRRKRNATISERRARGTRTGRFPGSMRLTKKRIKKRRMATPTYQEAISGLRGLSRKRMKEMKYGRSVLNLPRVKGRKVKGGRAVTLHNFTGTIVKRGDGTVQFLGRGRKR